MKTVIIKSLFISIATIILTIILRNLFQTESYLTDVGGLGAFVTVFGTLYGIMAAFVVFEVWGQYNKTSTLIDNEALGIERLFRLTLYFRDEKLTKQMRESIENYANIVISDNFQKLGSGARNKEASSSFRKIAGVIRDIEFNDDHDSIIYDHIVNHYGELSETRTERIAHCLMRLPYLLRFFLYMTSAVAVIVFVIMPFANSLYHLFAVGAITLVIAMVVQLVEDLDNPFKGNWTIDASPFKRALDHIKKDY
ncbi:DUF4239 domain-containing protein [Candidatus Gottesmanbacteria bacterium]|nr:DUF4239 domain-containing protein [Candidatus Gottesmanbacteria bacterium]